MSELDAVRLLIKENRMLKRKLADTTDELNKFKPVFNNHMRESNRGVDRVREKLKAILVNLNVEVLKTGLKIVKVDLDDGNSETNLVVNYSTQRRSIFTTEEALCFKDKMLMSDEFYHTLVVDWLFRVSFHSLVAVKNLRSSMNREIIAAKHVKKLDDKTFVVDFRTQIKHKLEIFLKKRNVANDGMNLSRIRLKLTADGTNLGRAKSVVNAAFMLVDDAENVMSVCGVNIFAVTEWSETYEELRGFYSYIDQQIKDNREIEVLGKKYTIDVYFCSDMKMICIVLGLYGPRSIYPSFICHANKNERYACDEDNGRTHETAVTFHGRSTNHEGYKHPSMLPSLPYSKFVIDPLHCDLRVVGRLIFATVKNLADLDGYKGGKITEGKHQNLIKWITFLNNTCEIRRKLTGWDSESDALITRDFNSNELDKIIDKINLERDFPDLENATGKQNLFKGYKNIFCSIKTKRKTVEEIKAESSAWFDLFKKTWEAYETPYIHLFGKHIWQFVEITTGDLARFTQQGHEKANDFITQHYFNASNRHVNSRTHQDDPERLLSTDHYLVQILLRQLRIQKLEGRSQEN